MHPSIRFAMFRAMAIGEKVRFKKLASAAVLVALCFMPAAEATFKRDHRKLRKHTTRHPLPSYIVECESHGNLRAINTSSGAGGRYQILPSTWTAHLPRRYIVRLAGGNKGPRWSSRLLQDIVAKNVRKSSGLGAWSCA